MTRMDNEWNKFFIDIDGKPTVRTQSIPVLQRVAEGGIQGYSAVEVMGENPDITTGSFPEDIWDYGGLYTFSNSADINRISSSDDGDDQNILVTGLDANWVEVAQFVTLTGQTPAPMSTPLIRVYELRNMGSTELAGDLYCFVNGATTGGVPDDVDDIRGMIRAGNNKTLMGIYTIPAGRTGYLWDGWAAVSRAGGVIAVTAEFTARSRLYGGVFAVQARSACMTTGNSGWDRPFKPPLPIPERTDILLRCEKVSGDCAMSGGFTIILKEN